MSRKKCVLRKCIKDIFGQIKIEGIPANIHYKKCQNDFCIGGPSQCNRARKNKNKGQSWA